MVLPEGSPSSGTERPKAPRLLVVALAIALLLGTAIGIGQLTAPPDDLALEDSTTTTGPINAPTTTTTIDVDHFDVSDIATGDRFIWFRSPALGALWPIEVVVGDGTYYVFGSTLESRDGSPGAGLEAWVSDDAIAWRALGRVIGSGYRINSVATTERGLIALGNDARTDAPLAWFSPNGVDWQVSVLPVETAAGASHITRPVGAASLGDRTVVVGFDETSPSSQITDALPAELLGDNGPSYRLGLSDGPDGPKIHVQGPLGIVGYSATLEELGIDDAASEDLYSPTAEQSHAWFTDDGVAWTRSTIDATHLDGIWPMPDGRLLVAGYGALGPMLWVSDGGELWERHGSSVLGLVQGQWADQLISGGFDQNLRASSDGLDWDLVGAGDLLPDQLDWSLGPIAAGGAGLAAVATAWLETPQGPSPVVVDGDGHTLTVDMSSATMTLQSAEGPTIEVPMWPEEPSDLVSVDFASELVTFRHPETGAPVASFDFATLDHVEYLASSAQQETANALLFTADRVEWSIHDLTDVIGEEHFLANMEVAEDRVILVSHSSGPHGRSGAPPNVWISVGLIGAYDSG